jgi:hypothetical protein
MSWRDHRRKRQAMLRVTAVGLLRAGYLDFNKVLPAFVEAVKEDPELLWTLASDYLDPSLTTGSGHE